jgi:hypothetical protein
LLKVQFHSSAISPSMPCGCLFCLRTARPDYNLLRSGNVKVAQGSSDCYTSWTPFKVVTLCLRAGDSGNQMICYVSSQRTNSDTSTDTYTKIQKLTRIQVHIQLSIHARTHKHFYIS